MKSKAISKKKNIPKKPIYFSPSIKGKGNTCIVYGSHSIATVYVGCGTLNQWANSYKTQCKDSFSDSFKKFCFLLNGNKL